MAITIAPPIAATVAMALGRPTRTKSPAMLEPTASELATAGASVVASIRNLPGWATSRVRTARPPGAEAVVQPNTGIGIEALHRGRRRSWVHGDVEGGDVAFGGPGSFVIDHVIPAVIQANLAAAGHCHPLKRVDPTVERDQAEHQPGLRGTKTSRATQYHTRPGRSFAGGDSDAAAGCASSPPPGPAGRAMTNTPARSPSMGSDDLNNLGKHPNAPTVKDPSKPESDFRGRRSGELLTGVPGRVWASRAIAGIAPGTAGRAG